MESINYKNSRFYEKYQDTYYSDSILADVFGQKIKKHRLNGITKMSYEDIYENNIRVMRDFYELYWKDAEGSGQNDKQAFRMMFSFYIDPDGAAVKRAGGIDCTADGLISLKRLYDHEGMTEGLIKGYEIYRKIPIFYFPSERNGINMTRAAIFGDRIDYTLFDLKRYFNAESEAERNSCRLISAYRLPSTRRWLEEMSSFEKMTKWFGVKGIFTDEKYEIIDIEKNDGSTIRDYLPQYTWKWSKTYYDSLRQKIEKFMNCQIHAMRQ